MPSTILRSVLLLLGLASAAVAHAATHCVDTASEFLAALASSAESLEDDEIRLVTGHYEIAGGVEAYTRGDLVLRGGWNSACTLQIGGASLTQIRAAPQQEALLYLRMVGDNATIELLQFTGLNAVLLVDQGPSADVTGTFRVHRSRFVSNVSGLSVSSSDKNVVIENNVFANNFKPGGGSIGGIGLTVTVVDPDGAPIEADVRFNTFVDNQRGMIFKGGGNIDGAPRVQNNVVFDSSVFDLRIDAMQLAATHNVWSEIESLDGGGFALDADNLAVDPLLAPGWIPTDASPVINSGTDFVVGGIPALDHAGGPRRIGSKPDRGAFESAVSDIDTLTVTNVADSGPGSLRQAILDANLTSTTETIEFAIHATCPQTIALQSPLPAITDAVVIDGFTQTGSAPGTVQDAYDGVHCVALVSSVSHALRFDLPAGETATVRGLAFYRFAEAAIQIEGDGPAIVEGNLFGTGLGIADPGFAQYALRIAGGDGSRIGGGSAQHRNVFARAAAAAIRLEAGAGRLVYNNFVGIEPDGYGHGGNGIGVQVVDGVDDLIRDNHIGFSAGQGVRVEGATSRVELLFNQIGRRPRAHPATPTDFSAANGTNGVRLVDGADHRVERNTVTASGTDGIVVLTPVQRAQLLRNRVYANTQLGIDLSPDGVNPNATDTGAIGANGTQNYPVLAAAHGQPGQVAIEGTLTSANGNYTIGFFAGSGCDDTGYGEGERPLGSIAVTIDDGAAGDGSVGFIADFFEPGLEGSYVTAIATSEAGNSSELSACVAYVLDAAIFADGFE
jgi:hypothetical protein